MSESQDRLTKLGLNVNNGVESMRLINWDFDSASLHEIRRAMGLHAIADVVRESVVTISRRVLTLAEHFHGTDESVKLLDAYVHSGEEMKDAVVRFYNIDLIDADEAAAFCNLPFEEFARRAVCFAVDLEKQKPGFLARAKAVGAQEDLAGRKALRMTDTQPWGDEDYRDYGVPDEE